MGNENVYQFTRSIRFCLEDKKNILKHASLENEANAQGVFKDFQMQYSLLLDAFKDAVYYENKEGQQKVKPKLEVKYPWLKKFASKEYYDPEFKKETKKYTIVEARFICDVFEQWLEKNEELESQVKNIISQPEENQVKRADLATLIKIFFGSDYLFFAQEFVEYANDKNSNQYLDNLKDSIEKIKILAEKALSVLAPDQNNGIEIARASFNFYTVNKISKNFDSDFSQKKEKLNVSCKADVNTNLLKKIGFKDYLQTVKNKDGSLIYGTADLNEISVKNLHSALKEFNAQQKKAFMELIGNGKWRNDNEEKVETIKTKNVTNIDLQKGQGKIFSNLRDLGVFFGIEAKKSLPGKKYSPKEDAKFLKEYVQKYFPLFDAKEEAFQKFLALTDETKKLPAEKNHAKERNDKKQIDILDVQIRDKKIKREAYFQNSWGFKDYVDYCKVYKSIAMEAGKIKAEIRSLEQEKIDARMLKYWSHIVQKGNDRFLLLIPKEKMSEAKVFLQNINSNETIVKNTLYSFNSFTLRAINKLIRKNCPRDIPEFNKNPLAFYKKVLKGEYSNIKLDLEGFEEKINELAQQTDDITEENFRIALESVSYAIQKKDLGDNDLEKLKNDFGAICIKITSYDLERKVLQEKEHTALWNSFWNEENKENNFSTRINPEVRIFYRKIQEIENPKKQKNRFSKEHFGVAFTVTQNAAQKQMDTAFAEEKDLRTMIKKFNEEVIGKFINEKGDNLYYYGIDRGNQELATLGIVQFSKEEYETILKSGEVKHFQKAVFPEIISYRIRNEFIKHQKCITIDAKGTQKIVTVIDNPSYFMKDDKEIAEVFEESTAPFIDLTTAKLIKGKIILNGDVKTYLALKKANAKRKLFDIFSKIDGNANAEFSDNKFQIKLKDGERNQQQVLCYYLLKQEAIFSREEIREELQKYLNDLRGDTKMEGISIDKINHLRDAITGNMVGIIAFLFEQYPGIINLENLHTENEIAKHFRNNNENIARRLEWSLYKKFQKKGLVPPRLRQTIFLRETKEDDNKINQFGIIHFIPTKNTSANCPYCEESTPKKQREKDKFEEHLYICRTNKDNCGFTTEEPKKPLEEIKNSDDVAAYNIAKKGLEFIINKKA